MEIKAPAEMQETLSKAVSMASHFDELTPESYAKHRCDFYNGMKGNLNELDGYDCPICLNRGDTAKAVYSEQFNTWDEVHVPCKCMEIRKTLKRLEKSGLKSVVKKYTFANYTADEPWQQYIKQKAANFLSAPESRWFFIGGQSGAGKTHICTAITVSFLKHGKSVRYMLWRDEATRLKSLVNDVEAYTAGMNELKAVDVLYIDDLFKTGKAGENQRPTPADINLAFELINFRSLDKSKTTIVSSECSLTDLLDIDEAIGGRIAEYSGEYCISIDRDRSKNYRLKSVASL